MCGLCNSNTPVSISCVCVGIPSRLRDFCHHSGPAGVVGDIRLWDVRASATVPVWEVREKEDCFADVAASDALSAVFKVGAASSEVFMADLRRLGNGGGVGLEPWVCIGDG